MFIAIKDIIQEKKRKLLLLFASIFCCILFVFTTHFATAQTTHSVISREITLSTGEWIPATTQLFVNQNQKEYQIFESVTSHLEVSGEKYQLKILENEPQFLSFLYRIKNLEQKGFFDLPIVGVAIDGQEVLQITHEQKDETWQEVFLDISELKLQTGTVSLEFFVQDSYEEIPVPSLEIKEVTTAKIILAPDAMLTFHSSKPVESVFIQYRTYQNKTAMLPEKRVLALQSNDDATLFQLEIPSDITASEFTFWSVDRYGNRESEQSAYFTTQFENAIEIIRTQINPETGGEISVQFEYQVMQDSIFNLQAKTAEIPIISKTDWENAQEAQIYKHAQFIDHRLFQHIQGSSQSRWSNVVFQNIPPEHRFISIKICSISGVCKFIVENQKIPTYEGER